MTTLVRLAGAAVIAAAGFGLAGAANAAPANLSGTPQAESSDNGAVTPVYHRRHYGYYGYYPGYYYYPRYYYPRYYYRPYYGYPYGYYSGPGFNFGIHIR